MTIPISGIAGFLLMAVGLTAVLAAAPKSTRYPARILTGAFLSIVSIATYNFVRYPPISDGAYFLLRYGHDPVLFPARASEQATAFCFAATSLYAALLHLAVGSGRDSYRPVLDTLLAIGLGWLTVLFYSDFAETRAYELQRYWPALVYIVPVGILTGLGWVFRSRSRLAMAALAFSGTALTLFLATIVLYHM